jgi:hypothetical protein
MANREQLDRREFLAFAAIATAANLMPDSLRATQPPESSLISLKITGDAQSG